MSSPCPDRLAACLGIGLALLCASPARAEAGRPPLRVCAEPDNMPLSSRREDGFENRLARLVADELGATLVYAWQPQRRGFVRKTFGADLCDLWMGVPTGLERVLTTRPYYRSTYVFVNRADAPQPLRSFADPRLPALRVGVQLVGDDLAATPAGLALARAGAIERVVGYTVYGPGSAAERISADLAAGRLDAALVWGPQVGWFTRHAGVPLAAAPAARPDGVDAPFEFSISVGVRKPDSELAGRVDAALARRADEVAALLDAYGVPRVAPDGGATTAAAAAAGTRP